MLLNNWGGGRYDQEILQRPKPARCTFEEDLAFTLIYGSPACAAVIKDDQAFSLIDARLVPFKPASTPPKFSLLGRGADNLDGRPKAITRAIRRFASVLHRGTPVASRDAMRWQAGIGLLENPLSSTATRKAVTRYLKRELASSSSTETDPRGRQSLVLSLDDTSHAGRVGFGSVLIDFTDAAEMRQDLYVNPKTFDIRSLQVFLTSTTLPELEPWMDANDGEALIYQRIASPVKRVRRPDLRQTRVSCKSLGIDSDGVCIDIGKPGGRYIVTGG